MRTELPTGISKGEREILETETGWTVNVLSSGATYLQRPVSQKLQRRLSTVVWTPLGARVFGRKVYSRWNAFLTGTLPADRAD